MSVSSDESWMEQALVLAARGQGFVEPNPMVGCVLVSADGHEIGSGFHEKFGQPHAERNAISDALSRGNADKLRGATAYVTLEPCCHTGKTPPCTDALIEQRIGRVVIAMRDPFAEVSGRGVSQLTAADISVTETVLEPRAIELNLPYLKRIREKAPWVIAKWAMSLDGKVATHARNSQWISSEQSRRKVHELRGRVDAIMVGVGTALADDPMLNTRPPELSKRVALRVVMDSTLRTSPDSRLVQTAEQIPTLIVAASAAEIADPQGVTLRKRQLQDRGVEIWMPSLNGEYLIGSHARLSATLQFLALEKRVTNLMLEGGSQLLGAFADADAIDECHIFMAPKLIGGVEALSPVGGRGFDPVGSAAEFDLKLVEPVGPDVLMQYVSRNSMIAAGFELDRQ